MVSELTASQVGTGSAWKLYICYAAATQVFGTRVVPGLHPGTQTGVKGFFIVFCFQASATADRLQAAALGGSYYNR